MRQLPHTSNPHELQCRNATFPSFNSVLHKSHTRLPAALAKGRRKRARVRLDTRDRVDKKLHTSGFHQWSLFLAIHTRNHSCCQISIQEREKKKKPTRPEEELSEFV
jgi:hypothetical protein